MRTVRSVAVFLVSSCSVASGVRKTVRENVQANYTADNVEVEPEANHEIHINNIVGDEREVWSSIIEFDPFEAQALAADAFLKLIAMESPTQDDLRTLAGSFAQQLAASVNPMLGVAASLVLGMYQREEEPGANELYESIMEATRNLIDQRELQNRLTTLNGTLRTFANEIRDGWAPGTALKELIPLRTVQWNQVHAVFGNCVDDEEGCISYHERAGIDALMVAIQWSSMYMGLLTEIITRVSGDDATQKHWQERAANHGARLFKLLERHFNNYYAWRSNDDQFAPFTRRFLEIVNHRWVRYEWRGARDTFLPEGEGRQFIPASMHESCRSYEYICQPHIDDCVNEVAEATARGWECIGHYRVWLRSQLEDRFWHGQIGKYENYCDMSNQRCCDAYERCG